MTSTTTEPRDTTEIFQQICNAKFVQERNIFPVVGSKQSELSHVKHSAIEQNLLQFATCQQSKLDKIGRLGYKLKYMSNDKVCMTTEHNNFLIVISKKVALQYQTAVNVLKDAISHSIPTSCNNQHLPRLSYLVRMIAVFRIAK